MNVDDPRHGTNAGYIAGCREQCCRTAHASYKKQRRTRVYLAKGPMKVDATGSRRRVHALLALGHTLEAIDEALDKARGYSHNMARRPFVYRTTADQIAELYDRWSMTVPEGAYAARNRGLAQRNGWLPPLAWDDERIDDPAYEPRITSPENVRGKRKDVDEMVVERLLEGVQCPSTKAERDEAMRRWKAFGRSEKSLCRLHGWHDNRYGKVA